METTYRLSSFASTTDVKELIPEFFFFPEFLCNLEGNAQYPHSSYLNLWNPEICISFLHLELLQLQT